MSTKIEWTDKTWNPIIGCSHISPACDHCYAEKMAHRLACNPNAPSEYANVVNNNGTWSGGTALVESALEKPLHWRKPCRVFAGSMTDLFHDDTPFGWLDKVFDIMSWTPHITYQILTKRPERMLKYMEGCERGAADIGGEFPWSNVWLGVTVENQAMADKRIPILLDTPAAVRFVSVEPMLEGINLNNGDIIKGLDWVICGGETGPGARRMETGWVEWLQSQSETAGVPFFFKKWGSAWGKGANNGHLDGKLCREFPQEIGG